MKYSSTVTFIGKADDEDDRDLKTQIPPSNVFTFWSISMDPHPQKE